MTHYYTWLGTLQLWNSVPSSHIKFMVRRKKQVCMHPALCRQMLCHNLSMNTLWHRKTWLLPLFQQKTKQMLVSLTRMYVDFDGPIKNYLFVVVCFRNDRKFPHRAINVDQYVTALDGDLLLERTD